MAMFEIAGVSIAMGQASEKVQRAASLVSSSNDDNGFAIALEKSEEGHRRGLYGPGRADGRVEVQDDPLP